MSSLLAIARHEWRLIRREPRFLAPFLLTPLLLLAIHGGLSLAWAVSAEELRQITRTFLVLFTLLMPSLTVPLSADAFAGERERRTFEVLFALPVSLSVLFWGKVLGLFPIPVLLGWAGQAAFLCMLVVTGNSEAFTLSLVVKTALLMPAMALLLGSMGTFISLGSESVRGAAQLSSLVMVFVFFSVMLGSPWLLSGWDVFVGFLVTIILLSLLFLKMGRNRFSLR